MFGLGVGHFVILLFLALIPIYIMNRREEERKAGKTVSFGKADRHCLSCGFDGRMKTWLGNYNIPQIIAAIGLLTYIVPGTIFIIWAWGKYKCPRCGVLGKNHQLDTESLRRQAIPTLSTVPTTAAEKMCPFCAETIKPEAIICRYCQRDLPPAQS